MKSRVWVVGRVDGAVLAAFVSRDSAYDYLADMRRAHIIEEARADWIEETDVSDAFAPRARRHDAHVRAYDSAPCARCGGVDACALWCGTDPMGRP